MRGSTPDNQPTPDAKGSGEAATFRPDIEGFRAIAVMAVVLFHAGIGWIPGGFVGVDIFFVISGFLITRQIQRQSANGTFAFGAFWQRRILRLMPASIATTFLCVIIGLFLSTPQRLMDIAASGLFSSTALSNFWFWLQTGYFDSEAFTKPLLHTWSLGVEEQFYLIWPPLLLLSLKLRPEKAIRIILGLSVVSLAAVIICRPHIPAAVFYLMPFRLFEFALGGALALRRPAAPSRAVALALFLVGLLGLLTSFVIIDEATPFPGLITVLPVLASLSIIYAGQTPHLAGWVLDNQLCRALGRYSYSIYLAHWPLVVFMPNLLNGGNGLAFKALLVCGSIGLGAALYFAIEKTFRLTGREPSTTRRSRLTLTLAFLFATCVLCVATLAAKGWPGRFPPDMQKLASWAAQEEPLQTWINAGRFSRATFEEGNGLKVLVVGDSMAADVMNLLDAANKEGKYQVKFHSLQVRCGALLIPQVDRDRFYKTENVRTMKEPEVIDECLEKQKALIELPELASADVVILASLWAPHALDYVEPTVEQLSQLTSARIVGANRKDFDKSSAEIALDHGRFAGLEEVAATFVRSQSTEVNDKLDRMSDVTVLSMRDLVCPKPDWCHVLTDDQTPVFFDNSHLTAAGTAYLADDFAEALDELLE